MRRWQDDPRFRCPHCQRLIYLTGLEPDERPMTRCVPPEASCEIIAICIGCQRVYTLEEWRQRHVSYHPTDMDT
jgi:hypothetical protein